MRIWISDSDAATCLLALREYKAQTISTAEGLRTRAQKADIYGHDVLGDTLMDAAKDRETEAARVQKVIERLANMLKKRAGDINE